MRFPLITLLILCVAACAVGQAAQKSKPVTIPKFDKPPVIDGKLDEEGF